MISFEQDEICFCGRLKAKCHCTKCGSSAGYALSKRATVQNPETGVFEEVNVYRCRKCNNFYNESDRKYSCRAPEYQSQQEIKKQEKDALAKELMDRVRRNEKLDHIDKLRFRKAVGMTYEAFMILVEAGKKSLEITTLSTPQPKEETEILGISETEAQQMQQQATQFQSTRDRFKEIIENAKKYKPKAPPPSGVEGFK